MFARCKGQHSQRNLLADKRSREAFVLAMEGKSCQEIGDILGYKTSMGAWLALKRAHEKFDKETIELMKNAAFRTMQSKLEECNKILKNADTDKTKLMAIETYRKFLADIIKLLGLNEPDKTDITSQGEPILRLVNSEWSNI